ncbi:MAG TPA: GDCCVxC domain-containing (seleno)protein [Gemmatimonadaceae bacterium]|nr:GDCCVxC domain-containing (seleno)protein [Gemmatimonadaceae bacterium]
MQTTTVLTCPECGRTETLEMPTDACVIFHECAGCGRVLRPRKGDCCVYCSYGSVRCPSRQAESAG